MHHGERVRVEVCEGTNRRRTGGGETAGAEDILGVGGGGEHVVRRDGGTLAELGEEIAAQECLRGLLEQHSGLPTVRHVWCVDVAHTMPAELDDLVIGEWDWRAVGEVVE